MFLFFCLQFYDALEDSDRLLASVRDLLGVDPKVCLTVGCCSFANWHWWRCLFVLVTYIRTYV